jgi:hypothetical protein
VARGTGARHVPIIAVLVLLGANVAWAQRIPAQSLRRSSIQGVVNDPNGRPVPAAHVELDQRGRSGRPVASGKTRQTLTSADGVFRFVDLPEGDYTITITHNQYQRFTSDLLRLGAAELVTTDLMLQPLPPAASSAPIPVPQAPGAYGRVVRTRPDVPEPGPDDIAPSDQVFLRVADRWNTTMPAWDRHGTGADDHYVAGQWWDPYHQNVLKGDRPILGQRTFFTLIGVSDSLVEGRTLSDGRPFAATFIRTSFDMFRGDTAYRPVDWRVRVQPAFSLNVINTGEDGAVDVGGRRGANRLSSHVGLQEAFGELKIADLSANYDFISVRAGIQEFSSDFRGFVSVLEAPGVRVFGTLKNSRIEYNAALFDLLEKDATSGLNEWTRRGQQVFIGNLYIQDFGTPGYTTSFSFHASRDRCAGAANEIDAYYVGWSGNGHIGGVNISHAFYQTFGHETASPVAAKRVDINAQMAAAELSVDKNWLRIKGAVFFASGDGDPADTEAHGFDAIVGIPVFVGGPFSLWNRQALPLAPTSGGLSPSRLLPANFVNPGVVIVNGGLEAELTPKLRGFANVNYLRFVKTEPLRALLFHEPIRPGIGIDYGIGVHYRPPLSDNIVIVGGIAAMKLGQAMKDIYTRNHLFSLFLNTRFVF